MPGARTAVFVALLDETAGAFGKIYAGRSTFSACNPEVLKDRPLDEFPWVKARLEHLRLLEISDTSNPPSAQRDDARAAGEPERRRRCCSSASISAGASAACSASAARRRIRNGPPSCISR